MFCPQCGKKIAVESVFCEHCGTKIDESSHAVEKKEEVEELKNKITDIQNPNLRNMANHLEFLGYGISRLELAENAEWVVAKHESNNNWVFHQVMDSVTFVQVRLRTGKKHIAKMDKAVNALNSVLDISRFYYAVEDGLVELRIEAIFTGAYSKDLFSKFYDLFERDQKRLSANEEFEVFLSE
jgi:hypothetical protein